MTDHPADPTALPPQSGPPASPAAQLGDIHIREVGSHFLATCPRIGAVTMLDPTELVAFHIWKSDPRCSFALLFEQLGLPADVAGRKATSLEGKLRHDGWQVAEPPSIEQMQGKPFCSVYFTVTRACNFTCGYCYQGASVKHTLMDLGDADILLGKLRAANPDCFIAVTGGEPLLHPEIFGILERVAAHGLPLGMVTNGSLLTRDIARRLAQIPRLAYVQVSLDGIKEETHNLTRRQFPEVMAGIRNLSAEGVLVAVAPTLHEGNLGEIRAIAELAYEIGGRSA